MPDVFSAAVAKEKKTQRATLGKQREDYKRRATALKRELNTLKEQRDDLVSGSEPPSPTTKGFIKENDRLQVTKRTQYIYYVARNDEKEIF